jgi:heme O synthase-like polyprenyltransferase
VLTLAGMLPCAAGVGGWFSGIGGLALSLVFLYNTLRFLKTRTTSDARRVFRFSLLYLPAFFVLLALDRASPNLMGH